jgi:hypothetical protein
MVAEAYFFHSSNGKKITERKWKKENEKRKRSEKLGWLSSG